MKVECKPGRVISRWTAKLRSFPEANHVRPRTELDDKATRSTHSRTPVLSLSPLLYHLYALKRDIYCSKTQTSTLLQVIATTTFLQNNMLMVLILTFLWLHLAASVNAALFVRLNLCFFLTKELTRRINVCFRFLNLLKVQPVMADNLVRYPG